jgi:hypothetical protein
VQIVRGNEQSYAIVRTRNDIRVGGPFGDVCMCDFAYELAYDSVYNLLPKVILKVNFKIILLKHIDRPLLWVLWFDLNNRIFEYPTKLF